MQDHSDLQQQPFPLSKAVDLFRTVKDLQGNVLQDPDMALAALIPFGCGPGGGNDIVVEIMTRIDDAVFLGVILGDSVVEA